MSMNVFVLVWNQLRICLLLFIETSHYGD